MTEKDVLPGAGRRCGLLGKVLGHSYSPQIHSGFCAYSYSLFEVPEEGLEAFLTDGKFDGINVTIPYKKAVLPYCAELSEAAGEIGSVNTIVRKPDGTLYGDNTDWQGFRSTIERSGVQLAGRKALVLGSGGASAAVLYVLRKLGAIPVVISRTGDDNYSNLERHADAAAIVNTTPLGMYPNNGRQALSLTGFPKCEAVFDLIYNPARTALMLEAERLGIPAYNGLWMLVEQARASASLFAGTQIGPEQGRKVYSSLKRQMENIILIGMPGCGKTTIGSAIAGLTGRRLTDADACLTERLGTSIPAFMAAGGVDAFRAEETRTLQELGKQSGLILATGGGCVTRPENYDLLHQNGTIVWLQRPLEDLPVDGRPLSQSAGVQTLYEQRKSLYARFADLTVSNDAPPEDVAARILELI